jgi:DNA polymerase-1
MPRLVLIDGSSYLYRAFHALPPLSNAQGEPTGALFGVVNMLRATLKEQPDCAAFVVDAPGRTFRDDLYPQYKANRPPMPDELRAQVEPMMEIVQALGFPILRIDGVEADDVIGTLALEAASTGSTVTISTSDKDFAQLVRGFDGGGRIELVNTMSGSKLDSDDAVSAKFGVRAAQIVDYLALMGDAIDNVPGVEKCGPKTAAKWLGEYGTLDGVIAAADAIKGKIGDNLRAALPRLPLNRELVTIKTDVAMDLPASALKLRERDADALRGLYTRYGFNQALRELNGNVAPEPAPGKAGVRGTEAGYARSATKPEVAPDAALAAPGEYDMVVARAQLDDWITRLRAAGEFAFDTETDNLDPMRANLVGISLAVEPGKACYIPLGHDYPGVPAQLPRDEVLDALRPLFADAGKRKLGQHGKYDIHILRRHGIEVAGYADDTMLESFVLNATASRHDMDSLAQRYLGYQTIKFAEVAGKGAKQITFNQVALDAWLVPLGELDGDGRLDRRIRRGLLDRQVVEQHLRSAHLRFDLAVDAHLEREHASRELLERRGALGVEHVGRDHGVEHRIAQPQPVPAQHDLAELHVVADLEDVLVGEDGRDLLGEHRPRDLLRRAEVAVHDRDVEPLPCRGRDRHADHLRACGVGACGHELEAEHLRLPNLVEHGVELRLVEDGRVRALDGLGGHARTRGRRAGARRLREDDVEQTAELEIEKQRA